MTEPSKINDLISRFDWYQTTIDRDPQAVYTGLSLALGATSLENVRGVNGFTQGVSVKRDEESLAVVYFGGRNPLPNVKTTSWATDDVAPAIRALWPTRHEVTRVDSAADFDEPDGYLRVAYVLGRYAKRRGIYIETKTSTRNGVTAATTYLGAASSRVRLRLYQKGLKDRQDGLEASEDWYRCELQIRPTGDGRVVAATVTPDGAWGFSSWSRAIAEEVMSISPDPIVMQPRREPDYMRAIRALRTQYGSILARALEVEGSPEAVLRLLQVIE